MLGDPGDPGSPDRDRIVVDYRLAVGAAEAPALARRIAFEQTVELPEALVTDPHVLESVVGRVEAVEAEPGQRGRGAQLARLSFDADLAGRHLSQLLNLIFGNVSIYPGVRLESLHLPPAVLDHFDGPKLGIQGVRELTGVHHRALLATALKPRGARVEELARLAREFALGGGDIVKDDQNLVDDLEAFKRRVAVCRDAVEEANQTTGKRCLYLPHVSAPLPELNRQLDYVYGLGLPGVLICPMIVGLDATRTLLADYPLLTMAHPALSGAYLVRPDHGIAHQVLLGTLFRLAGADLSIFPHHTGRFSFTEPECRAIHAALRAPLGRLRPAWPCPAGGLGRDDLGPLGETYGLDSVMLVGGGLHGHELVNREGLRAATAAFVDALPTGPPSATGSSPEVAVRADRADLTELVRSHLPFKPGFGWTGRESSAYKGGQDLAFKGVRRVELVGKFGERTRMDLRYFEVLPGGFTSREKHVHTHIIIGARGLGELVLADARHPVRPFDVAYLEPLAVHQLRNAGTEPFGFFCIVDHERDRPMEP